MDADCGFTSWELLLWGTGGTVALESVENILLLGQLQVSYVGGVLLARVVQLAALTQSLVVDRQSYSLHVHELVVRDSRLVEEVKMGELTKLISENTAVKTLMGLCVSACVFLAWPSAGSGRSVWWCPAAAWARWPLCAPGPAAEWWRLRCTSGRWPPPHPPVHRCKVWI